MTNTPNPSVLIALIGVLFAVACSPDPVEPHEETSGALREYARVPGSTGFDGAGIAGELVLLEGCLSLRSPEGDEALVFESGSAKWDSESKTLQVDDTEFKLGDQLSAGGGFGAENVEPCGSLRLFRVAPGSLKLGS